MAITNCILWNDYPEEIYLNSGNITVNFSDIQGQSMNIAPLFINSDIDNYHLQAGSPCIDQGTVNGAPTDDKDGNVRDSNPDMGAYEFII